MATLGNQRKSDTAPAAVEDQESEGPRSVAQPKERKTVPCPAPAGERERQPDTIPAPAWFEIVD